MKSPTVKLLADSPYLGKLRAKVLNGNKGKAILVSFTCNYSVDFISDCMTSLYYAALSEAYCGHAMSAIEKLACDVLLAHAGMILEDRPDIGIPTLEKTS